ncbi:MAG: hypothetical protein EZS28_012312, partial [Streblomastix strix]
ALRSRLAAARRFIKRYSAAVVLRFAPFLFLLVQPFAALQFFKVFLTVDSAHGIFAEILRLLNLFP